MIMYGHTHHCGLLNCYLTLVMNCKVMFCYTYRTYDHVMQHVHSKLIFNNSNNLFHKLYPRLCDVYQSSRSISNIKN